MTCEGVHAQVLLLTDNVPDSSSKGQGDAVHSSMRSPVTEPPHKCCRITAAEHSTAAGRQRDSAGGQHCTSVRGGGHAVPDGGLAVPDGAHTGADSVAEGQSMTQAAAGCLLQLSPELAQTVQSATANARSVAASMACERQMLRASDEHKSIAFVTAGSYQSCA